MGPPCSIEGKRSIMLVDVLVGDPGAKRQEIRVAIEPLCDQSFQTLLQGLQRETTPRGNLSY